MTRICTIRRLVSPHADANAIGINPANLPPDQAAGVGVAPGERLALDVTRYWGPNGVHLTVGFVDTWPDELRQRILLHMNAWAASANVSFVESKTEPMVRIARLTDAESPGHGGYWSYLGTDVLLIEASAPTMNLESFTMATPDDEFHRVVRHETGHTMGFPHEHMRKEIIGRLDPEKVIKHFMASDGWTEEEVRAQVLTALEDASTFGTPDAEETSIMCYSLPGALTIDGKDIEGGADITPLDYEFAALVYPKA